MEGLSLHSTSSITCMIDESNDDVWFCEGCNDYVCENCWNKIRAHRQNALGAGDTPHERVTREIKENLEVSLAAPTNEGDSIKQHQEDVDTTWFGLDRDEGGDPILSEYRRYAAVMMDCMQDASDRRYPRLVSFIGETGE